MWVRETNRTADSRHGSRLLGGCVTTPPPKRQRSIDDDDDDYAADETETEQRGEGRVRDEKISWLEILRSLLKESL